MKSMTGFGQAVLEEDGWCVSWTARSVNHRHLDLAIRIGDEWRALEPMIRQVARQHLDRGRVELTLAARRIRGGSLDLVVDEALIEQVVELERRFERRGWVASTLDLGHFLRIPEAIRFENADPEGDDAVRDLIERVLGMALEELVKARGAEGARLETVLRERCDELGGVVGALDARRTQIVPELGQTLELRLAKVLGDAENGSTLDSGRLEQEVAILVDKSDVQEELDRLRLHLEHFAEVMSSEGIQGKRLDFLTQELLRELNTVGAKCRDAEMTRGVIDGKILCEQMREQVQNVE